MIDPKRESMLIEQVLAERKEVFAELVDAHKNKIYGLLRSMGAGHQDAQDYTQEAFVKAYPKAGQLPPGIELFVLADQGCR